MSLEVAELSLVKEAINGSRMAFEDLVKLNEGIVLNWAKRFGPREEVENISQDVFISAYKAIAKLNDPLAFHGWLHSIAIRRCRDSWRAVYRKKKEISLDSLIENNFEIREASNLPGAAELQATVQGRLELDAVLNQLSADDRMIMTLLYLEDKPVTEVSALLGLTQVNVKVRAHRIKKRLLKLSTTPSR